MSDLWKKFIKFDSPRVYTAVYTELRRPFSWILVGLLLRGREGKGDEGRKWKEGEERRGMGLGCSPFLKFKVRH